jgi:hypothetical protein
MTDSGAFGAHPTCLISDNVYTIGGSQVQRPQIRAIRSGVSELESRLQAVFA